MFNLKKQKKDIVSRFTAQRKKDSRFGSHPDFIDWAHGPGTTVDTIMTYTDIDGDGITDSVEQDTETIMEYL